MAEFRDHDIAAQDGLRLFVRDYGPRNAPRLPVVCLPGLARTCADFEPLAAALSEAPGRPRRVIAPDYRGRGRSAYDPDPSRYTIPVEANDVLAVLTALEVGPAVFVGTSRGGLITMALAAMRPTSIAAAVFNDIGPAIEPKGLIRIKGYVGKLPAPRDIADGAEILRRLFNAQFPKLRPADWQNMARRTWRDDGRGGLALVYDPKLERILADFDPEQPLPAAWPQFDALAGVPLMVVRGALSDILSAETVAAMRARRSDLVFLEVPDQGHAPHLAEAETIARIADFIAACDAGPATRQ